jgi:hypothetical protein
MFSQEFNKYTFEFKHVQCLFRYVDMCKGRGDRMLVGFTTTYAIGAYHH